MKAHLLLLAVVLALSTVAVTQNKGQAAAHQPFSPTTCTHTFNSGSGENATQFCVTDNGNITQFSRPSGFEYINFGNVSEGYAVCDLTSNAAYYDYAGGGDSGWGTASVTSTSTSVQVTRTSTDGVWTLTQTIKQVKGSATSPGAAAVSMVLKNNSATKRIAYIYRYADVNADGYFANTFFSTLDTAYGLDASNYQGLSSINNTFNTQWAAYTQAVAAGPDPCNPANSAPEGFVGDGSLVQVWGLIVSAGAKKTVAMTYKPM